MSAPMTKEEIAAVLADHIKWLRGEGGKRADLTDAVLTDADLTGAVLTGARLTGAILTRARLTDAVLTGATVNRLLRRATRSDGWEFFLWHCQEGFFIAAGCHWFTPDEARQHWTATRVGTPLGDETQDILDFFDAAIKRQEAAP
jgi:hypothetical protein